MPGSDSKQAFERIRARISAAPGSAEDVRASAQRLSDWILGRTRSARRRAERAARIEHLILILAAESEDQGLRGFLAGLRREDSMVRLLAETGIPGEVSLAAEAGRRVFARGLSIDVGSVDFAALCAHAHLRPEDHELVEAISPRAWDALRPLLAPAEAEVRTATLLVLRRATALGLSRPLLALGGLRDRDSPFFALEASTVAALEKPPDEAARRALDDAVLHCRAQLVVIHARMQERGVSTGLLFALDHAEALLDRLSLLARLHAGDPVGRELLRLLLRSAGEERSLVVLIGSKLEQLARKVVEHASHAGDHYVVRTAREYFTMGLSAAWGGALAAVAAFAKLVLSKTTLAPGLLGLAYTLNYAICFTVMQLCGFTLASRQPSMTAAALARNMNSSNAVESEIELVAGIARAQTIAAAGNVLVAFPAAAALDACVFAATGRSLLDAGEVLHVHEALTARVPMNVLFGALTGVFLWLSSLASGWASNWSALHSLPVAISESPPLRGLIGRRGAERLGRLSARHFGGLFGYFTLSLLMGFAPLFATFMGVALAAPHVTIATASLALAMSAEWHSTGVDGSQALWSLAGVLGIGVLNFGVSFALAFELALRSMGLQRRERLRLLKGLARAFTADPLQFFVPRRETPQSSDGSGMR